MVHGNVTAALAKQLQSSGHTFFACGISIVLHPLSPMIPTVHANFRYFEMYDERGVVTDCWFGGGCDLTPYYLFENDVIHFHSTLKSVCDKTDVLLYPEFKKTCDEYFYNKHRNESRGVGGIFYDYMRPDASHDGEALFQMSRNLGDAFLHAYLPIVQRRRLEKYEDKHVRWQEIRRGRYVEFNLIHDRGTLFGLKSGGRTQSILMSLPPRVRFEYDDEPEPGTEESRLLNALRSQVFDIGMRTRFEDQSVPRWPSQLTTREVDIIRLVVKGHSTSTIANELNLSPHTISTHRKNIIRKLKIKSPVELVAHALEMGLIAK